MKFLKYVAALILRLCLVAPFILLASLLAGIYNLLDGVARMFEQMADGVLSIVRSLKPFTRAPYVKEWNDKIETLTYEEKKRILRELSDGE